MFAVSAARTNAGIRRRRAEIARVAAATKTLNQKINDVENRLHEVTRQVHGLASSVAQKDAEILRLRAGDDGFPIRKISAKEIVVKAAECHDVDVRAVVGSGKLRKLVECRHDAIAAIRWLKPNLSFPNVGKYLGGRDHTTIIHACQRRGYDHGWKSTPSFDNEKFREWAEAEFNKISDD